MCLQSAERGAEKTGVRLQTITRMAAVVVLAAASFASLSWAQGLGAVAQKEEERRKSIKGTGKTYTNENLKPEPPPPPPPSGMVTSTSTVSSGPSSESEEGEEAQASGNEASWRKRMADAREAQSRAQAFADALQSQINGLTTDFVNRDDPEQRAEVATSRDKAMAELERVKKELDEATKAVEAVQDDARKAGVPAGWVR